MVHTSYRDEFDAEDLEEFFENAPVPIQCLAPDGTVLQANRALLDLLGYERGRYVGQPFVDFHADSAVVVNMHAALTNGEPVRNMPARLRCQDRSVREVLITSSAYWKEDQLVHTRWLIHDAGESKRYERVRTTAEEKFQQVFQASPDAMSIATLAEGRFVDVNASYLRQTGHRREEVIGKTTAELDRGPSPEARVKLLGQLQLALERDGHVHEVLVTFYLDGERRDCLFSAQRIELDGVPCVISTSRDITEHKRAEDELRNSEARFRALAENSRAGIVTADGDRVTYANPRYAEMTGYTVAELLNMNVMDLVLPDSRQRIADQVQARLRGEAVTEHYEIQIVTKQGEMQWVEIASSRTMFAERPLILSVVLDITDRKRAEQNLQESEARFRALAEKSRAGIMVTEGARFTYVNPKYIEITGYTKAELLRMGVADMVVSESRQMISERREARLRAKPCRSNTKPRS